MFCCSLSMFEPTLIWLRDTGKQEVCVLVCVCLTETRCHDEPLCILGNWSHWGLSVFSTTNSKAGSEMSNNFRKYGRQYQSTCDAGQEGALKRLSWEYFTSENLFEKKYITDRSSELAAGIGSSWPPWSRDRDLAGKEDEWINESISPTGIFA